MSEDILEGLSPAQLKLYHILSRGAQVKRLVGNNFFIQEPNGVGRFHNKRIHASTFKALHKASLLKLVNSGENFGTYELKCLVDSDYMPSAFGIVSVKSMDEWVKK